MKCENNDISLRMLLSNNIFDKPIRSGVRTQKKKQFFYNSNFYSHCQAWNPAAEDQCFDRCHRLGQTEEVKVYKVFINVKLSNLQTLQRCNYV